MTAPKSQLRIIGGQWRGRNLEFSVAEGLRPTGARIRETLFNWLQDRIEGASCLDLFTGSGALAFEACSRGAGRVVMVENNPLTARSLQGQMMQLQANNIELWQGSALDFLKDSQSTFDLVLLDPPFAGALLQPSIEALASGQHLNPGAFCYLEYPQREVPALPKGWYFHRQKKAGEVGYGLAGVS
ncbi:MAG: 16S rRNA (guanine(966)-N(2))-methyltransferase RsmD [Thiothrix sp.]|nr:MAG: 16S rRNA (guanine(966)-N(2))-methyltransferase RsmD [Thiothrix sp.]